MKALALYGSTARHERDFDSDIDLLGIYDGELIHQRAESIVNIFLYPEKKLIEKMVSGDLFALHLVKESIPIFGEDIIHSIYSHFKYKDDYTSEIGKALFISKIILDNYELASEKSQANKKLAWCLRTIIIALSAQKRCPVFSKKLISEYIQIPNLTSYDIFNLINSKNINKKIPDKIFTDFSIFFNHIEKIVSITKNFSNDPLVINTLINVGLLKNSIQKHDKSYE